MSFKHLLFLFIGLFIISDGFAQVNYTANDQVTPYTGGFKPGSNMGYYPGWSDDQLADIAAGNPAVGTDGVGVKALRPALFGFFLENWGYEARVSSFQHYDNLGVEDNTCIIGFPSQEQRDPTFTCSSHQSELYANMYEPIWDGGANGTPVNDDNYLALYLYKIIQSYGPYIKFWEVWNEPGFDYSYAHGWLPPGSPGNWWENDPDPCDVKTRAPVQHYVRMLRVCYDVIKTLSPDDYVTVAGVGYPSFLDAILRNTDNPNGGTVTADYPNKGGAYFDCMGFHSYPHFDGSMKYWDNNLQGFVYERHSDKAAEGIARRQQIYQDVMDTHGYDGATYPKKEWIVTELNLPRVPFNDYIGTLEAQINFIPKAVIQCIKNNIRQCHIWNLGERTSEENASDEFDLMGMYKHLEGAAPYTQIKNDEGIAYKTTSDLLYETTYDAARTAALNLPSTMDGGAFQDANGDYIYVLWAKTSLDQSEAASESYTFPAAMNVTNVYMKEWDYAETLDNPVIPGQNIQMTGRPIFLSATNNPVLPPTADFAVVDQTGCAPYEVAFESTSSANSFTFNWSFPGGTPSSSTEENPVVTYNTPGQYTVALEVSNSEGNDVNAQTDFITVGVPVPVIDFNSVVNGTTVSFSNNTTGATTYSWDFGDGNTSSAATPTHTFATEGAFDIQLTATNSCGTETSNSTIFVGATVNPVSYTAQDFVQPYDGHFRPGSNAGYYPPWEDEELANLAAGNPSEGVSGAGVKAIRPAMFGWFAEQWGYDFRVPTYDHYDNIGLKENTMIVGFPPEEEREPNSFCSGGSVRSELYKNLYEPIWDDGANGTPINDNNDYAVYLYKVVNYYKDYVRFWEIWNEPGFDYTGAKGWLPPGFDGNWWENDPDPCDYKLRAPIQHYVRLLRISYEVIKAISPESYVTIAGVGYPSFLDAICRNTDNPNGGAVTADYPLGGGAYFDCMGFHSYPHFDGSMRYWDSNVGGFVYSRHSDAGADGILRRQNEYQSVLDSYGFNGGTFPKKEWIVTEINLPRKQFGENIGSVDAQRNFTIKAVVTCMVNDINQMHIYSLSEIEEDADAQNEFDLMGLYNKLTGITPYNQVKNTSGITYKTTSDILFRSEYDATQSAMMNLPTGVRGYAFLNPDGNYVYVLWAETTIDQSEAASEVYSFPAAMGISQLEKKVWDYSDTNTSTNIASTNIQLTAQPIFLIDNDNTILIAPTAGFEMDATIGCSPFTINYSDASSTNVDSWSWSFPGGTPSTSTAQNPTVVYSTPGTYDASLTVTNTAGSNTTSQSNGILVGASTNADFTYNMTDLTIDFDSDSDNGIEYFWAFGDGTTSTELNPTHEYASNGYYTVILQVESACGTFTTSELISVGNNTVSPPTPSFTSDIQTACAPVTIEFTDLSTGNPNAWQWSFPGGNAVDVNAKNPTVMYTTPGVYNVTLIASNDGGSNTVSQSNYIVIEAGPTPGFTTSITSQSVSFSNSSINADTYLWDFGDGQTSTQIDPMHTYASGGTYTVTLTATNDCGPIAYEQDVTIQGTLVAPTAAFSANQLIGCSPMAVQFTNQSSGSIDSFSWSFPGGTPSTSTDPNPTVTYSNVGNYNVTLVATNAAGNNSSVETNYITVSPEPIANFTSNVSGSNITLSNSSLNASSYSWNFGDGITSTSASPTHTYDMDGNYTITLSATNACGTVSSTETIIISTLMTPTAGFSSSITTGCSPMTVNFTDLSSANTSSWQWTFPGGTPATSTLQNPVVTYDNTGIYDVTLIAGNAAGNNTSTQSSFIVVNTTPVISFASSISGNTINLTNNSSGGVSYAWDFGDGTSSNEPNPTHTYANNGTYVVQLTGTNSCGTITETETILISTVSAPTADFTANITSGCGPFTVNFTDLTTGGATSWEWSFPGGSPATSTDQNPSVIYAVPGNYTVSLIAANSAGNNSAFETDYIEVGGTPNSGFLSMVNGSVSTFINSSSDATSYSWDFGDGTNSTEVSPQHTYVNDGTYTVILSATNACGTSTSQEMITINTLTAPMAGFSASTTTGCAPMAVQFNDSSSANTSSWNWTFEGGTPATSTAQNPSVTFAAPGTYTVTLEATNAAGSSSISEMDYIVVADVPASDFTSTIMDSSVQFNNASNNATNYSWTFGDGNTSTEANPNHTYATDGEYTVVLSAINSCGTVTSTQQIIITSAPIANFGANVTSGCSPLSIDFINYSSTNTNTWNWTFNGGTPSTSNDQNPSVIYNTPGTYTVSLEVVNAAGTDVFTQTSYIIVESTPNIGFSSNISGSMVNFNNTSSNAISYSWDFGDGNYSNAVNPMHTYAADGDYTVILTANNACGAVMSTQDITVTTLPLAGFTADLNFACAPSTVNYTNLSSPNATEWNWTFEGGTPATSTDQNPIVSYATPGVYSVTLVSSNSAGSNSAMQTDFIVIEDLPTASYSANVDMTSMTFNNTSIFGDSYAWDFGDGNTSTLENPVHVYSSEGMYTISLSVTNGCGTDTYTQQISTSISVLPPVASFVANQVTGCSPMTVQFSDASGGDIDSWAWSFPGGTPSTSSMANPVVEYSTPGNYNVSLVVTNIAGSSTDLQTEIITIIDEPTASFNFSSSGSTVNFSNTGMSGTSHMWDFGDGNTSMDENPSHEYSTDGAYIVTLTSTNACGTESTTQLVNVITAPIADFSTNGSEGCAPMTIEFSDQSSSNTESWAWSFPGGIPASSDEQNPIVTYNTPGTYDVTLIASNAAGGNILTQSAYIVVSEEIATTFSSSINGNTVDFNSSATGTITNYLWDFGDGNTSTSSNPSHTYDSFGDYEVSLMVTSACGMETITQTISISNTPIASFSADQTEECVPFSINFTDESSGNPSSWAWNFPGGTPSTSTDQNPSVTYDAAGSYEVELVVENDFGTDTYNEVAYVNAIDVPQPSFGFAANGMEVTFTNTTLNGNMYSWDFGDGNAAFGENISHTYETEGIYTVTLTVTNDCGTASLDQIVSVIISGYETLEGIDFDLFPNPNNGAFTLKLSGTAYQDLTFSLINIIGQQLHQETLNFSNGNLVKLFDFKHLTAGSYIVQLKSGEQQLYKKLIIE